jgi:hypothetical protein
VVDIAGQHLYVEEFKVRQTPGRVEGSQGAPGSV